MPLDVVERLRLSELQIKTALAPRRSTKKPAGHAVRSPRRRSFRREPCLRDAVGAPRCAVAAARRRGPDTNITRFQALLEDHDGVGAARQREGPIVVRGPVCVRQHIGLFREIVGIDQNVVRHRPRQRRVARRGRGAGVARPPRERLRREAGLARRAAQPSQSSAAHRDPVIAAFRRGHDRRLLGLADPVRRVGDRRRRAGENLQRWPRSTCV
mgnify:CR=1 FL=1